MNEPYFYNKRFLGLTTLLFVGITLAFVVWPVPLPQLLTVFGVLALFTLCIVAFCLYLSLLTIEYRLPVISGASGFRLRSYHRSDATTIRLTSARFERPKAAMKSAAEEFERWYESRPNLEAYDEYPVYLVAAQGGGMYAAYQTAIFLARLQDNCPAFRNHLFAISSVSGGSVGAATFVSALRFAEQAEETSVGYESRRPLPTHVLIIAEYYPRAPTAIPGQSKKAAGRVRRTRRPTKKPANSNDRSETLGPTSCLPSWLRRCSPISGSDLSLSTSVFGPCTRSRTGIRIRRRPNFDPQERSTVRRKLSAPLETVRVYAALFMNATDAGSGRRVLISPFALLDTNAHPGRRRCSFRSIPRIATEQRAPSRSPCTVLDISLSTAAGISARFPLAHASRNHRRSDGASAASTEASARRRRIRRQFRRRDHPRPAPVTAAVRRQSRYATKQEI